MRVVAAVIGVVLIGGAAAASAGIAIVQAINEAYSRYGSGHGPRY